MRLNPLGTGFFYGIERSTKKTRKETRAASGKDVSSPKMFWISIAAFAACSAAIGYLLTSEGWSNLINLFFFTLAIALHFVVNDRKHLYARDGR